MENDPIFQPLSFRNLTVKNRIFRSSISGRWDNYDGSGTNEEMIAPVPPRANFSSQLIRAWLPEPS